jgi:hypothetical protein
MQMKPFALDTTDWMRLAPTEHAGESGVASWRTREFDAPRVRLVEYTPGYRADHGCRKAHILLCIDDELRTGLADSRRTLAAGMSYRVGGDAESHRSSSAVGARLFIVDCDLR